ncbi:MAG: CRISPR-associated protein Cas4, partial [Cellulosilyticaceae bacterium]
PLATPIYSDEKGTKLLVAPKADLQGKPDYIFKTWFRKKYIPLEIKSSMIKEDYPHEGDLMQLVTYFLIIEEVYGKKPPYGKLVYKNKTFKIRNTLTLRMTLKKTIRQMRGMLKGNINRCSEPSYIKCKNCICQYTVCEVRGDNELE